MNRHQLYTIDQWEKNKPDEVCFTRVFFTQTSNEVRKVAGKVSVPKKRFVNGEFKIIPTQKNVRWDGFGRCYMGTHNVRKRNFDILLKQD